MFPLPLATGATTTTLVRSLTHHGWLVHRNASLEARVVHSLLLTVICGLYSALLGEAGLQKLIGRQTPAWFIDKFATTWMGRLPAPLLWWGIALAELSTASLFVASLVTGEPFAPGEPRLLGFALVAAASVFSGLCFGLRVASDFVGAVHAFAYAGVTLVLATLLT